MGARRLTMPAASAVTQRTSRPPRATGRAAPARPPHFRPPHPALVAKVLVPSRRAGVVTRRRLLDQLQRHVERRLQLVVAPAGYGKTTLLVEFVHEQRQRGRPVYWLTLDEHDADARSFFEHLVLSVRQRFPAFGGSTAALLQSV